MPAGDNLVDHIDWKVLKGKEARGVDKKVDLGEIQEIGDRFIVTKRGRVSRDKFYIPKYLAQSYDGKRVWFNIGEGMLEEFKRDSPPPAEEYAKYRTANTPSDIEDKVVIVTEVPLDTEETASTLETPNIPVAETVVTETSTMNSATPVVADNTNDEGEFPVRDWHSVIHKNVRSMDGEPVGTVIALYPDSFHVESEGDRIKYDIPKSEVAAFNGAEVQLKAPVVDLERYVKRDR